MIKRKTEEDLFIEQYGKKFFDGGDAEAQHVYLRLKADGWIRYVDDSFGR